MTEIALIGNPNCGKTTLFNALTGSYQKTGNWTGVTTEQKSGVYKKDKTIKIIDLPGLYSLDTNSEDERVVLRYLNKNKPRAIINIVDGTNLERNLYLTCELASLGIPTVIAVNMYDELLRNGITLSIERLKNLFGVPVVPISALKGTNIDNLVQVVIKARKPLKSPNLSTYNAKTLIESRYKFLEDNISGIISKNKTKTHTATDKIDKIILNKYLCLPIFFCVLTIIYYLSIKIGGLVGEQVLKSFNNLATHIEVQFLLKDVPIGLTNFVCDAIIISLGSIFSLLPQILILFMLLCILEQSGYSARIAFVFDKIFSMFGLSGKSIVPMLVSCGCTVAGINATRTIESTKERRATIFLSPFMPCGAKMAVFGYFSYAFFNGNAFIASSMYFVSIICVAIFGLILNKLKILGNDNGGFILEIPSLRMPSIKDVWCVLIEKTKDFLLKVGTTILILSILLWLLKSFGISGYVNDNVESSFLFSIGNFVKFIFYPLGFSSWQASVSIICGIFAKEGIVETLHLIAVSPKNLFGSGFSAYAFMCFILLSPPCISTLITAKKELVSKKLFVFMLIFQFISAYIVAFIVNLVGIIINHLNILIFCLIIGIIISIVLLIKIKSKEVINVTKSKNNVWLYARVWK